MAESEGGPFRPSDPTSRRKSAHFDHKWKKWRSGSPSTHHVSNATAAGAAAVLAASLTQTKSVSHVRLSRQGRKDVHISLAHQSSDTTEMAAAAAAFCHQQQFKRIHARDDDGGREGDEWAAAGACVTTGVLDRQTAES